ncbi:VanW family protein [bacterium]|nr:VanW family protein [bacterium]
MRRAIYSLLMLILSVIAFTSGFITYFHIHNLIFPRVYFNGIDIGGIDLGRAKKLLEKASEERSCVMRIGDRKTEVKFSQIGLSYDSEVILRSAFAIGRRGWHKAFREAWQCLVKGIDLNVDLKVDNKRWTSFIKKLKEKLDKPAINARPIVQGKQIVAIRPAEEGYGVDEKRLFEMLCKVKGMNVEIEIPMKVLYPKVRAEDLEGMELLSEFSTSLWGSSAYRIENIKRAVSAIDGTLLSPGERFSFNEKVGPRVLDRGYKVAPVMIRGELVPGIGGGVCQVSTTLYNAVLLAGLKIERRAHHARPVKYVSPGRDATVVYGYIDLIFQNDSSAPIYVQGEVRGGRLIFRIFGRKEFDKINVYSIVERKPDGTIIAKTYRVIKIGENNKIELVSSDIYRPLPPKENVSRSLLAREWFREFEEGML